MVPKGSVRRQVYSIFWIFDIPLENAYAFGDGNNDAPMLLYCPNSIIMEKGPEGSKTGYDGQTIGE
ncbi:MAG: HAD hydrolase family protein [Coprococcus sp.]